MGAKLIGILMPSYNYRCDSCAHEFELIKSVDDRHGPQTLPCPECSEKTVMLQMAAPAICSSHRVSGTSSSKPQGDFIERMQQIKKGLSKDKRANIPDF
jgi:putative FmdB family regulatory protein